MRDSKREKEFSAFESFESFRRRDDIFFILSATGTSFVLLIADVTKMKKFKWNSSLLETRRLFPSIVLKQYFLAK